MKRLTLLLAVAAIAVVPAFCDGPSATGTTSVGCTVGPEASITVTDSTSTLSKGSSGIWGDYTGSTGFSYKMRTSETAGTGSILMQFGGALTDAATDAIPLSNLSYTCASMSSAATKCGGGTSVVALSSGTTAVATFGTAKHLDGETGEVDWTLTGNSPSWKTGAYSATATFTIAAL